MEFSKIALDILEKRYLIRNENGELSENPKGMFRRVAKAVAEVERLYNKEFFAGLEEDFFNIMWEGLFLPNTPTLMNAGRPLGQLSACFVLPIEDSMESIFDAIKYAALIHKSGGGTGFTFGRIRPKGDYVRSTGGMASGPLSFMKIYNAATGEVKQGRARRGANMGIQNDHHPDIEEFITCKTKEGEMSNFNISVAVTDKFMQAVKDNSEYDLINPRTGEVVKTIKAAELFDKICEQTWLNGEPGIIFIDKINAKNPLPGTKIEATNPCITGDSLIQVVCDREKYPEGIPIKDLVGKNDLLVHAYDIENRKVVIAKVLDVWKSGKKPVYKITYKWLGGKGKSEVKTNSIKVTADHKIMMKGSYQRKRSRFKEGQYVACENLKPGDLIMPFTSYIEYQGPPYFIVCDTSTSWMKEADLVAEFMGIERKKNEVIHHIDHNSLNDIPENLENMDGVKHSESHGFFDVAGEKNPNFGKRHTKEWKKKHSKRMKAYFKNNPNVVEKIRKSVKEYYASQNHEIVSIEYVGEEDVFDMTVEKYHNFAVNGIFVKNCGEQPLLPYESCNLGSINLAKMVYTNEQGETLVDYDLLASVTRTAVRFLDNIIDANEYPLPEIKEMTVRNRKIGLGIMGLADMLFQIGLPYNSKEGLETVATIMQKISYVARSASYELGREKGSFLSFGESKYKDNYTSMRNATTTTIAPTGTISLIAGASASGEPSPFLVYRKKVVGDTGENYFDMVNSIFETYLKKKVNNDQKEFDRIIDLIVENGGGIQGIEEFSEREQKLFVTAPDISPDYHVRMQAILQSFTDNAVSKTLNLPNSTTVEEIKQVYLQAYDLGCKGVTAYRIGSRQDEVMSVKDKHTKTDKIIPRKRPPVTYGPTYKINTGCGNLYITINSDDHGLCEVFIRVGKSGGCALAQSEAITRGVSRQLRAGIDIREIIKDLSGIRCPNPAWNNERMILSCPDAIAFILEKHINGEKPEEPKVEITKNKKYEDIVGVCECGGLILREGRCATCQFCGFSKC